MICKIDGLKFLGKYFPEICVDCVFVGRHEPMDTRLLENHPGLFRVRSGRAEGAELSLPRRTCRSITEVQRFIHEARAQDNRLEFVIHRVNEDYFDPVFVGTLGLFEKPYPEMVIQVQVSSRALVAQMDKGIRARDWEVAAIYRFRYLGMKTEVTIRDPTFQKKSISPELYCLWKVGREIDSLKKMAGMEHETVTLFNIYPASKILLDDHRSLDAF